MPNSRMEAEMGRNQTWCTRVPVAQMSSIPQTPSRGLSSSPPSLTPLECWCKLASVGKLDKNNEIICSPCKCNRGKPLVCNVLRDRQQEARQQTQMKKETGGAEERISWANCSPLPLQQSGCVKAAAARIGWKGLSHGHRLEGPVMANARGPAQHGPVEI